MKKAHLFLILLFLSFSAHSKNELIDLIERFDRDGDRKITLDDKIDPGVVYKASGMEVQGLYQLSVLAQELKYSELTGKPFNKKYLQENPVDRISRSIRERYWDGLTRRIEPGTLDQVIQDPKIKNSRKFLYVPFSDEEAWDLYSGLKRKDLAVVKLPQTIPSGFITGLGSNQGLLSLALKNGKGVPYVVPGGRFNEMYGWDSYFHALGVIQDGKPELAKSMVENFVYEINHYGKILNANRTYYLTRSQPPFLTSMILAVIQAGEKDLKWIESSVNGAIKEYEEVWMGRERLTETGLSRYAGFDEGIPPEVEEGHFNHVLKPWAKKYKLPISEFINQFNAGKIKEPKLLDFFHQDRAVRESGHDTTYRWRVGSEDRASDFVTVDLNSLLYKYELDLAKIIQEHFKGSLGKYTSKDFLDKANKRKALIKKYLWDNQKKMFFDFNWKTKKPSEYVSAVSFYPLWAGKILTNEEAKAFVLNGLKYLEGKCGLFATSQESLIKIEDSKNERQWEYPYGWAPHQMLAWYGLKEYGLEKEAHRLIYKWLYMITKNAVDYNGTIPEKYNVETCSHKVFVEYGNVGTKFSYITLEGFGWMNASYQVGLSMLPVNLKTELKKLRPPEEALK